MSNSSYVSKQRAPVPFAGGTITERSRWRPKEARVVDDRPAGTRSTRRRSTDRRKCGLALTCAERQVQDYPQCRFKEIKPCQFRSPNRGKKGGKSALRGVADGKNPRSSNRRTWRCQKRLRHFSRRASQPGARCHPDLIMALQLRSCPPSIGGH